MTGCCVFASSLREEKKKKQQQKQEGCETEEKPDKSSGGPVGDQGSKSGSGPSQQPLKRGQKVRRTDEVGIFCAVQASEVLKPFSIFFLIAS